MASHIDAHKPDRVPARIPARFPAVDTSWQGDPPVRTSTGATLCQSICVMSPRFGTPGWWYAMIRAAACDGRGFFSDGGSYSLYQASTPPMTD